MTSPFRSTQRTVDIARPTAYLSAIEDNDPDAARLDAVDQ
jgi:hypothetical protein